MAHGEALGTSQMDLALSIEKASRLTTILRVDTITSASTPQHSDPLIRSMNVVTSALAHRSLISSVILVAICMIKAS